MSSIGPIARPSFDRRLIRRALCDDYDEGQRKLTRRDNTFWLVFGALIVVPTLLFFLH